MTPRQRNFLSFLKMQKLGLWHEIINKLKYIEMILNNFLRRLFLCVVRLLAVKNRNFSRILALKNSKWKWNNQFLYWVVAVIRTQTHSHDSAVLWNHLSHKQFLIVCLLSCLWTPYLMSRLIICLHKTKLSIWQTR